MIFPHCSFISSILSCFGHPIALDPWLTGVHSRCLCRSRLAVVNARHTASCLDLSHGLSFLTDLPPNFAISGCLFVLCGWSRSYLMVHRQRPRSPFPLSLLSGHPEEAILYAIRNGWRRQAGWKSIGLTLCTWNPKHTTSWYSPWAAEYEPSHVRLESNSLIFHGNCWAQLQVCVDCGRTA